MIQLAVNDNISASNLYSRISFNFTAGQNFFIKVENLGSNNGAGFYNLSLGDFSVSGPSLVCGSATFSATNLPPSYSIAWSATPSGRFSLTQTGNQAQLTSISSGGATLQGLVTVSPTYNFTVTKQVWSSRPNTPGPITVDAISCPEYYFSTSCAGGQDITSYTWQYNKHPSGPIFQYPNRTCNSPRFVLTPTGSTFRVGVQAINSCGSSAFSTVLVTVSCGGSGQRIAVFPNPTSNFLEISLNETFDEVDFEEEIVISITLVDRFVATVIEEHLAAKSKSHRISTQGLPRGLYFFKVVSKYESFTERVLLQ